MSAPPSVGHSPDLAIDVALAADSGSLPDLLTPWIDQFNAASANTTALTNAFFEAPGVGTQQMIANLSGYLQDFFNSPTSSTVTSISHDMQANLSAVQTGYSLQDATSNTFSTVTAHTLDGFAQPLNGDLHAFLFEQIPGYLPPSANPAELTPIFDFLASPLSGIIIGMLGPEISPWVALMNSMTAGDDLNTTLANMVGAYFNGATLNLDGLIPLIEQAGVFPSGLNLGNLDIAFGGLLSPGSVGADGGGVGGSIFNSLGIELTNVPSAGVLDVPSQAVGPLGALEGWAQTVALLLGWDGTGSPLADVTLPTIPDGFLDGGSAAASAVADMSTWVQDLFAAL